MTAKERAEIEEKEKADLDFLENGSIEGVSMKETVFLVHKYMELFPDQKIPYAQIGMGQQEYVESLWKAIAAKKRLYKIVPELKYDNVIL